MCITISSVLFSSIAADLLCIAQSIWTFVTTKNYLECRGYTWTFFAGTNFALRTVRGKSNVRQCHMQGNVKHLNKFCWNKWCWVVLWLYMLIIVLKLLLKCLKGLKHMRCWCNIQMHQMALRQWNQNVAIWMLSC